MKTLIVASAIVAAILGWSPVAYAERWVYCATEGGFCSAPYGAYIHYGQGGAFAHLRSPPGGLPCNNFVFGDPLFGVPKQCFFSWDME